MIQSFKCKHTAAIFAGHESKKWSKPIQLLALRKLMLLNAAIGINDLRSPPGNRLEKLTGDRFGQWSIRINDQWRLCFGFDNANACDVEIVDYH